MAGIFGFFNFEKEGPGVSKNAPKKKTFVVFFETFFANFWRFITINLFYSLISLPIVTMGLANSGITNVTRNIARNKHSFGISDFIDTIKKNWKQSLIAGIINVLVYIILGIDIYYFYFQTNDTISVIGLGFTITIFFVFTVMNYFIWTLMITFKFNLKQIYKNSFSFVFLNLKNNLICFFSIALVYAVYIAILFVVQNYLITTLVLELMVYSLTFPAFKFLLVQYCVFPSIKKFIIDPYYEQYPNEDIEKRRDLGIEIKSEQEENIESIAEDDTLA